MTDDAESFCNAWKSVFGEPTKRLLCTLARGSKLEKKRSTEVFQYFQSGDRSVVGALGKQELSLRNKRTLKKHKTNLKNRE
ncbi:hypothetical protein CDAR_67551 [Caerostris darwini]|uniref:LAGLIDADG homing endonuclease n=1 Tax=Caerostris darwini TaxID=1538125 RepID=A0AAV4VSW0_9ARAC|nr:hypothetical protein CDAR_67551 [Caerostris darwini]